MTQVMEQLYCTTKTERETIYKFLKIVFEGPLTMETLKLWKEGFSPEFIEVLSGDNDDLDQFFEDLRNKDLIDVKNEQRNAYLATFDVFNKKGRIPAPPWESVYITKDKSMFGEPVFQIRRQLDNFGLEFVNKHKEPEDHIALELEFMSYLIEYTADALQLGNEEQYLKGIYTQYWLHKEHFYHWIKRFTNDIQSSETSHLYKGVAKLLQSFVEEDFEYIKSIKEGLENE